MTPLLPQALRSLTSGDYRRSLRQLSAACLAESPHSPTEAKIYTVRKYLAETLDRQGDRLDPWQVDVVRIGIEARIDAEDAERAAATSIGLREVFRGAIAELADAALGSGDGGDSINWSKVNALHSALIAESRRASPYATDLDIATKVQRIFGDRARGVEWEIAIARFGRWER